MSGNSKKVTEGCFDGVRSIKAKSHNYLQLDGKWASSVITVQITAESIYIAQKSDTFFAKTIAMNEFFLIVKRKGVKTYGRCTRCCL